MDLTKFKYILDDLKDLQSEERFYHTLGVAYTAANLSMHYGADPDKAFLAGLLHDCAKLKDLRGETYLDIAKKYDIPVSDFEKIHPSMLHGKVGAAFAKEKYGIDDEEIISAIECHILGKPNMNLPEKILFVADYIEPGRYKAKRLSEIRKLAYEDIDKCIYSITEAVIEYLKADDLDIDDEAYKTLEFYKTR